MKNVLALKVRMNVLSAVNLIIEFNNLMVNILENVYAKKGTMKRKIINFAYSVQNLGFFLILLSLKIIFKYFL